jgi:hypothetical protein
MFSSIRQSTQRIRLWLIAAAAILALTSVLEAGHVHGVFTQTDDQCTLCQHSVSLDKPLNSSLVVLIPLLLSVAFSSALILFIPQSTSCFALIRAPPVQLHTR